MNQPETCITRTKMTNAEYPQLYIQWTRANSQQWDGEATVWNQDEAEHKSHTVQLLGGSPIGHIYIHVDSFVYGCWAMGEFEGVEITQRDLQWAGLYTALALTHHPDRVKPAADLPTPRLHL